MPPHSHDSMRVCRWCNMPLWVIPHRDDCEVRKLLLVIADLIEGEDAEVGTPQWHALRNARAALDRNASRDTRNG